MVHPYNGIALNNKKEQIIDTHTNMDESQVCYANWKKPITKGVWFHLYDTLGKAKIQRQKTDQWLPGAEVGDRLRILWDTGIVLYPTCGGGGYKNLYMC